MGEELAADYELEHEVERDVVLERAEKIDDKGVLQGVSQVLKLQPRVGVVIVPPSP